MAIYGIVDKIEHIIIFNKIRCLLSVHRSNMVSSKYE
jgi:hypothetical protein